MSVLARLAVAVCDAHAAPQEDQHDYFVSALVALACDGNRRCVTSERMLHTELEPLLGNHPRRYAPGIQPNAFTSLDCIPAPQVSATDSGTRCVDTELADKVGPIDRSLLASLENLVTESRSRGETYDISLVTNDESFRDWIFCLLANDSTEVYPIASIDLLVAMVQCGAMDGAHLVLGLDAEEREYYSYENPPTPELLEKKLKRIRTATNQLAAFGKFPRSRP